MSGYDSSYFPNFDLERPAAMNTATAPVVSTLSEPITVGTVIEDPAGHRGLVVDVNTETNDVNAAWAHRHGRTEWIGAEFVVVVELTPPF
jgi:hypothetical protein